MSDTYRVLYVEDEPYIRTVARVALEGVGGFDVEVAASGREGIEKARVFEPDVILLDEMMPGMDGLATFRALREDPQTASIPVVFVTAKVQPHEILEYKRLGAVAVIPKPFDPFALPSDVRLIVEVTRGNRP